MTIIPQSHAYQTKMTSNRLPASTRRSGNLLIKNIMIMTMGWWALVGLPAKSMAAGQFKALNWAPLLSASDLTAYGKVTASLLQDQILLLGTGKGLLAVDLQTSGKPSLQLLSPVPVLAINQDRDRIYIINEQGLATVTPPDMALTMLIRRSGIRCLAMTKDKIYLGTTQGLLENRQGTQTLQPVKAVPQGVIEQCLSIPTGIIIRNASQQIYFFDPSTAQAKEINLEFNELQAPVKAMMAQGDYLWFATAGSGLIGYNIALQEWKTLKREHMVPYAFSLAHNGSDLWIGTHDAVALFRTTTQQLITLRSELFLDQELTTILLGNRQAVLGSSSGQWYRGSWQAPLTCQLDFPRQRHLQSPTLTFPAVISGQDPKTFKTYFKNLNYEASWFPLEGEITTKDNLHYQFTYQLSGLPKGQYLIRVQVGDQTGFEVGEEFTIIQQDNAALIKIENTTFREGDNMITGSYPSAQFKTIELLDKSIPVQLDPEHDQFTFRINLTLDDRVLAFKAMTKSNAVKTFYFYFQVFSSPVLHLSTDRPLYLHHDQAIEFNVGSENLKQINQWTLTVMDRDKKIVHTFSGRDHLPTSVLWPWEEWHRELPPVTKFLVAQLEVEDPSGYRFKSNAESMILLKPDDDTTPAPHPPKWQTQPENIYFASGQWIVTKRYHKVLEETAQFLEAHPDVLLVIEGHADNRPYRHHRKMSNQTLSVKRAQSVGQHIEQDYHISGERIICMGFGARKPLATNHTATGRAKNRRVVMKTLLGNQVRGEEQQPPLNK